MKTITASRNAIAHAICAVLLALLCSKIAHAQTVEEARSTIRIGVSSAPITLDPRFATDALSGRISRLIYRGLVRLDEHFDPVPDLATWQAITPHQYRFTLRANLPLFHDGSPLTANDVVATYQSILDIKSISPHRGGLIHVKRIVQIDEVTIDFYLDQIDPLFPTRATIGIPPSHRIDAKYNLGKQPIGNGPFRLTHWDRQGRVTLKRYRNTKKTLPEHMRFEPTRDVMARLLKVARGQVDLVQGDIPAELLPWLRKSPNVAITTYPGNTVNYIGLNLDHAPTRDPVIRLAIAHAIDRKTILKYLYQDQGRPAETILPPTHWATNLKLLPHAYNPGRATTLLRSRGYSQNHPLRLTMKISKDPLRVRLATILQQQLKAVGIILILESYDWGTFYGDVKAGNFDMYILSWVGINAPDIFRYAFHSASMPPHGANRGRLDSTYIDTLIEQAETRPTQEQQAIHYQRLQKELHDLLPFIPLWYEDIVVVQHHALSDYTVSADGSYNGLTHATKTVTNNE